MKVLLLTGHHPRHCYVAKCLADISDKLLVVSAAMGLNPAVVGDHGESNSITEKWFEDRFLSEMTFFNNRCFEVDSGGVISVRPDEINSIYVYNLACEFEPDVIVVYGTGIIKSPLLGLTKKIINMHLGISPYYNGAGTNWWPMYNNEYELVGTTIHYIDAGVDTGPILGHCRALIEDGDTPHMIGNKNIVAGADLLCQVVQTVCSNYIEPVPQWKVSRPVYMMKDFTHNVVREFKNMIDNGMIDNWVKSSFLGDFDLVCFNDGKPKIVNAQALLPRELVCA